MLERLPFCKPEAFHDFRHPIGSAEVAHQIVFEADIKSRSARIALPRATATKLSIYPAGFVSFGSKNKQSAELRHPASKFNVRAAAGHVRGNGDRSGLTRALNDLRFLHVKLRIQHIVRNFFALEHSAE